MKKVVCGNTVRFFDGDCEKMYLDHSLDECIWYFCSDDVIVITEDMELYGLLDNFMNQEYVFGNDFLQCYKDENRLIWYSDCYYDPSDEWSVNAVSCLHIERKEDCFNVWCSKKLDDIINRKNKSYCICFSPCGNGKLNRNLNTGLTLQDDFVIDVYRNLLDKNKILKK